MIREGFGPGKVVLDGPQDGWMWVCEKRVKQKQDFPLRLRGRWEAWGRAETGCDVRSRRYESLLRGGSLCWTQAGTSNGGSYRVGEARLRYRIRSLDFGSVSATSQLYNLGQVT